jgi:hypothetical protein
VATTVRRDVAAGVTTLTVGPLDAKTAWCFTVSARYADALATSPVVCLPR